MKIKTCTKCKIEKPFEDFSWRNKAKGTKTCWCKECFRKREQEQWKINAHGVQDRHNEKVKQRRIECRQLSWDILKHEKCNKCGEGNPILLEFDHLNPKDKKYNISDMTSGRFSKNTLLKEIEKCRVLCANCHRMETAIQQGWYKHIDNLHEYLL